MFSIVIPLYNKRAHIGRAIHSVLNQTYQKFELIIVDDGSSDDSAQVVNAFKDSRIKLIRQDNEGVSSARNRGIEESRGILIAFLDADDQWKPTFLETILRMRGKHPEAGLYATAYEIVTHLNQKRMPKFYEIPAPPWEGILPSYFRTAALGDPPVCASAVCIPKEVIKTVGMFSVGKRMGEDLDLWGRISLRRTVAFSWQIGASYHHDASNRACSKFNLGDEHPFILSTMEMPDSKTFADQYQDLKLYIIRLKLENARQHVIIGNFDRARYLLKGCLFSPLFCRSILWGTRLNYFTRVIYDFKRWLFCLLSRKCFVTPDSE